MTERVVITGLGALTAAGATVDETWQSVKNKASGIAEVARWSPNQSSYKLGAEIKNYKPRELVDDRKLLKLISRLDVIGLNAAKQAVLDSGVTEYRDSLSDPEHYNDRTGVFVGGCGNKASQQYDYLPLMTASNSNMRQFGEKLFEQVHPMWLLRILPNNVLAYTGIQYGFKGANHNVTNHAISGTQALYEAMQYIRDGIIDRAVVVGYDSGCEALEMMYYARLGVLSNEAIRPFDKNRSGTIMGEAGGAIVLESLASARERKAKIYGEVLGGSVTCEATGHFGVKEEGEGLARVLQQSLDRAGIAASDVGMVTAHANATPASDHSEALAIKAVFGTETPVTGYKWCLGHTLAAAGVVEAQMTLKSLQEGMAPGIASLHAKAADSQGIAVSQQDQAVTKPVAALISRGFAGLNACVILKATTE